MTLEGNIGICLHFETGIQAEECEVNNNGQDGISGSGTAKLEKCTITENGGAGVKVSDGGTNKITVRDCSIVRNGSGVNVTGPKGSTNTAIVDNCNITGNGSMGVNASGASGSTNKVTVNNSTIADNGGIGVRLHCSATGSSSSNNTVTLNDCTVIRNGDTGVSMKCSSDNWQCRWNKICRSESYKTATLSDCTIAENVGDGIRVSGGTLSTNNITLNNCEIKENIGSGIHMDGYVSVANSTITNNGSSGISLAGIKSFSKNCVSRNAIGVKILSDASGKIEGITGNDIFDNTTYEMENASKAEVVADDNYWGEPTTKELQLERSEDEIVNFIQIFDQQDNPDVGKITIPTYRIKSIITVPPLVESYTDFLCADGKSTTTITAILTDSEGNPITDEVIEISVDDGGEISNVTNNRDGTYTATYTAGTTPGIAIITAKATKLGIFGTVEIKLGVHFTLKLYEGINLISVPLKLEDNWRLSELAHHIGQEDVQQIIHYNHELKQFFTYFDNSL